jgi:hypothetical protein
MVLPKLDAPFGSTITVALAQPFDRLTTWFGSGVGVQDPLPKSATSPTGTTSGHAADRAPPRASP